MSMRLTNFSNQKSALTRPNFDAKPLHMDSLSIRNIEECISIQERELANFEKNMKQFETEFRAKSRQRADKIREINLSAKNLYSDDRKAGFGLFFLGFVCVFGLIAAPDVGVFFGFLAAVLLYLGNKKISKVDTEIGEFKNSKLAELGELPSSYDVQRDFERGVKIIKENVRQLKRQRSEIKSQERQRVTIEREEKKKLREANIKRQNTESRAYLKAMRGEARQGTQGLRKELIQDAKDMEFYECPYCFDEGFDISEADNWEVDHIIPIKEGGATVKHNCVLVCKNCNQAKGVKGLGLFLHEENRDVRATHCMLAELEKNF